MSVYVDDAVWPFGRMLMCHMFADSLEELLEMADIIKVDRRWIQGHPTLSFGKHKSASWVHFDISKGMREKAIRAGALACDRYATLIHIAKRDIKNPNPAVQQRGFTRLRKMIEVRANRNLVFRFSRLYTVLQTPQGRL